MAYSDFTLRKVKQSFDLTTVEGVRFLPEIPPLEPSAMLQELIDSYLPWAIAVGSEKAKSEMIVAPILWELKRLLHRDVSIFSGRDFTVDSSLGLNGTCDFLISRSAEQLEIESPAVVLVEAKRDSLNVGLGQCIAEMVAAQLFNQTNEKEIPVIYGATTSGTAWRFLKLENKVVTIDLTDYPLPPLANILGMLAWMIKSG
ncbi:hypothetical protein [Leptothoe kymatousa]|uniref:Uncharacterized protein n=1 Tax=Leptothoe kymatousa TAU-MAC 1615 TaxID=2364775 RepID=A0ABS5Y7B0_9CYAN|nr:hypothetical protein [Leptothoe kymatousa]MBT9313700.1 hypothetical protein [Leptothoe kymatousa TAU-MAC 1615]